MHQCFFIKNEINCYNEKKSKKEACDCLFNYIFETLVENPPFLTKSFQLHDICNYVSTRFFNF